MSKDTDLFLKIFFPEMSDLLLPLKTYLRDLTSRTKQTIFSVKSQQTAEFRHHMLYYLSVVGVGSGLFRFVLFAP
jgi:hypothetical protein